MTLYKNSKFQIALTMKSHLWFGFDDCKLNMELYNMSHKIAIENNM